MQLYMYPSVVWWYEWLNVCSVFLKSNVPYLFLCGVCIHSVLYGEHMPVAGACNKIQWFIFVWMCLNNASMYLVLVNAIIVLRISIDQCGNMSNMAYTWLPYWYLMHKQYNIHIPHMYNISSWCGIELDIPFHTGIRDGTYKYVVCNLFLCACREHTVYFVLHWGIEWEQWSVPQ